MIGGDDQEMTGKDGAMASSENNIRLLSHSMLAVRAKSINIQVMANLLRTQESIYLTGSNKKNRCFTSALTIRNDLR